MLTVKIVNDGTGDSEIANYKFVVKINDEVIASDRISNFKRSRGWKQLLREVIAMRG